MRGKPLEILPAHNERRITPADAGKTLIMPTVLNSDWDHPRGCGENLLLHLRLRLLLGSPPRMRGKHSSKNVNMLSMRITPADAGKTCRLRL